MALLVSVVRLQTGATLLQQHLTRGICTKPESGEKEGPAITKGRCWELQRRSLGFLKIAWYLLAETGPSPLSAPTWGRPLADPQEGCRGTCPAQGAQPGGWSCSLHPCPQHKLACLEPTCKYIWGSKPPVPRCGLLLLFSWERSWNYRSGGALNCLLGIEISNKHHLCEVQHQSSCCRKSFTLKPVFFLKGAEGMLFNAYVNPRDCCLRWVTAPWNWTSSEIVQ